MPEEREGSALALRRYSPALLRQVKNCRRPQVARSGPGIYREGVAQRGRRPPLSSRPSRIPGPPAAARALPTCWFNEPILTSPAVCTKEKTDRNCWRVPGASLALPSSPRQCARAYPLPSQLQPQEISACLGSPPGFPCPQRSLSVLIFSSISSSGAEEVRDLR